MDLASRRCCERLPGLSASMIQDLIWIPGDTLQPGTARVAYLPFLLRTGGWRNSMHLPGVLRPRGVNTCARGLKLRLTFRELDHNTSQHMLRTIRTRSALNSAIHPAV